ncbi:transposase [Gimesia chilikensis]|nr:transposase [Gimesia chilikensis]
MDVNMNVPRRKVIRLAGYDYSQSGFYFLTSCTQHSLCLFGTIQDGNMFPNQAGKMVQRLWMKLNEKYPQIILHEMVVMPNHIHGIIQIDHQVETEASSPSVAICMQWFKTMTTNEYLQGVRQQDWQAFLKRLWQRSYYEHIIRDEEAYHEITEYIKTNPGNWGKDKYFM